ncbi:hypothetical protein HDU97_007394 [Phlyctochytrium planicorne]|nr:hypothetical protein HDU97_007394 [Phlyctochytrium planicorne]
MSTSVPSNVDGEQRHEIGGLKKGDENVRSVENAGPNTAAISGSNNKTPHTPKSHPTTPSSHHIHLHPQHQQQQQQQPTPSATPISHASETSTPSHNAPGTRSPRDPNAPTPIRAQGSERGGGGGGRGGRRHYNSGHVNQGSNNNGASPGQQVQHRRLDKKASFTNQTQSQGPRGSTSQPQGPPHAATAPNQGQPQGSIHKVQKNVPSAAAAPVAVASAGTIGHPAAASTSAASEGAAVPVQTPEPYFAPAYQMDPSSYNLAAAAAHAAAAAAGVSLPGGVGLTGPVAPSEDGQADPNAAAGESGEVQRWGEAGASGPALGPNHGVMAPPGSVPDPSGVHILAPMPPHMMMMMPYPPHMMMSEDGRAAGMPAPIPGSGATFYPGTAPGPIFYGPDGVLYQTAPIPPQHHPHHPHHPHHLPPHVAYAQGPAGAPVPGQPVYYDYRMGLYPPAFMPHPGIQVAPHGPPPAHGYPGHPGHLGQGLHGQQQQGHGQLHSGAQQPEGTENSGGKPRRQYSGPYGARQGQHQSNSDEKEHKEDEDGQSGTSESNAAATSTGGTVVPPLTPSSPDGAGDDEDGVAAASTSGVSMSSSVTLDKGVGVPTVEEFGKESGVAVTVTGTGQDDESEIDLDALEVATDVGSTSTAAAGGRISQTNLYVRGLAPFVTDAFLFDMCKMYGTITSSKAILDLVTHECKGFGFVMYETEEEAQAAMDALTSQGYQESFNARLQNLQDEESTNIYISNLPLDMDEEGLKNLFLPHPVVSNKILRDSSHNSRGVGFARMESREASRKVIEALNGVILPGTSQKLQVRFADSSAQKRLKMQYHQEQQYQHMIPHHHRGIPMGTLSPSQGGSNGGGKGKLNRPPSTFFSSPHRGFSPNANASMPSHAPHPHGPGIHGPGPHSGMPFMPVFAGAGGVAESVGSSSAVSVAGSVTGDGEDLTEGGSEYSFYGGDAMPAPVMMPTGGYIPSSPLMYTPHAHFVGGGSPSPSPPPAHLMYHPGFYGPQGHMPYGGPAGQQAHLQPSGQPYGPPQHHHGGGGYRGSKSGRGRRGSYHQGQVGQPHYTPDVSSVPSGGAPGSPTATPMTMAPGIPGSVAGHPAGGYRGGSRGGRGKRGGYQGRYQGNHPQHAAPPSMPGHSESMVTVTGEMEGDGVGLKPKVHVDEVGAVEGMRRMVLAEGVEDA